MRDTRYPTFYKVTFWDETDSTMITMHGLLIASSPVDAAQQLQDYYGEREIETLQFSMCEENYLVEIDDPQLWKKIFNLAAGGRDEVFP